MGRMIVRSRWFGNWLTVVLLSCGLGVVAGNAKAGVIVMPSDFTAYSVIISDGSPPPFTFYVPEYDFIRIVRFNGNGAGTPVYDPGWPDTPPLKLPSTGFTTLSGRSPETMVEFQAELPGEWEVGFTPLVTSVTDADCCNAISLILASNRGSLGRLVENEKRRFVADPVLTYRLYLEGSGRVEQNWLVSARALSASTSVPAPGTLGLIAAGLLLTLSYGVKTFRPLK